MVERIGLQRTAEGGAFRASSKGYIPLCLEGELHVELQDGRTFTLTPGVSYQVADDIAPHRSHTATGAKLFIVD